MSIGVYMHESWRESASVRKKVKDCESRHTVGRGTEGGYKFRLASVPAQVYVCIKSSPQLHRHSGDPTSCVCVSVSFLKVINLWQEDMGRQKEYLGKLSRFFQIRNLLLRQALAECLGTLILVVSVCVCVCSSAWESKHALTIHWVINKLIHGSTVFTHVSKVTNRELR